VAAREPTSITDRGQVFVDFKLSSEDRSKIAAGKHQLRLYCTSSVYHVPSNPQSLWATQLCPMEFPPVCEIKVNGRPIPTNRGMKKKAGTAPPADVTKFSVTGDNKIEMNYLNNVTPFHVKVRFLFLIHQ
jgi:E3 SUMO-protein ligase PIAS1